MWNGLWTAVIMGDMKGARQYIHSHKRHGFPGKQTVEELQEIAYQMSFCRLDPVPFPPTLLDEEALRRLPPGSLEGLDELIYLVHCEHAGETAETQVGVRRDLDGVWRLFIF